MNAFVALPLMILETISKLRCRIDGKWDHQHSLFVHLIDSIFRSVQLPFQHKVPLQNLGPLCELDTAGTGIQRMDLIITDIDLPQP